MEALTGGVSARESRFCSILAAKSWHLVSASVLAAFLSFFRHTAFRHGAVLPSAPVSHRLFSALLSAEVHLLLSALFSAEVSESVPAAEAAHAGIKGNAAVVLQRILRHVAAAHIIYTGFAAVICAADRGKAPGYVDISVGIQSVAARIYVDGTAGDIDGIRQLAAVGAIFIGRINGVIIGIDCYIASENVHHRRLQGLRALFYCDNRALPFASELQDSVRMDRIVARGYRQGPALNHQVIPGVDGIVCRRNVDAQFSADCKDCSVVIGVGIACLNTVFAGGGVDRQIPVAGQVNACTGFYLHRRPVKSIRGFRICGILVFRVLGIRQRHVALNDDLYLAALIAGDRRPGGTGQIQILQDQDHAGGFLLDLNVSVGTGARNHICAGCIDGHTVVLFIHGDRLGVFRIRFQFRRAVDNVACDNLRGLLRECGCGIVHAHTSHLLKILCPDGRDNSRFRRAFSSFQSRKCRAASRGKYQCQRDGCHSQCMIAFHSIFLLYRSVCFDYFLQLTV